MWSGSRWWWWGSVAALVVLGHTSPGEGGGMPALAFEDHRARLCIKEDIIKRIDQQQGEQQQQQGEEPEEEEQQQQGGEPEPQQQQQQQQQQQGEQPEEEEQQGEEEGEERHDRDGGEEEEIGEEEDGVEEAFRTAIRGICLLVRPEATQLVNPSQIFHMNFFNTTYKYMAADLNHLQLSVSVGKRRYIYKESLMAEMWNALCLGVAKDNETQVWAVLDGQFLSPIADETIDIDMWMSRLCFGNSTFDSEITFTGMISSVYLMNDIPDMAPNCTSITEDQKLGTPLSLTKDLWLSRGPEFIIEVEEDPCVHPYHDLLLNQTLGYNGFLRLCRSLGGRLPYLKEALMNEVGVQPKTCDVTGKNVWWMGSENMTSEGMTTKCPVLLTNMTMGWRPCLSELNCSLCRVPTTLTYTVYGELMKYDRNYSLKLLQGGGFFLEGDETSKIIREGEDWVLQSNLHQEKMWLPKRSWPMGRHLWHSIKHNTTLTLSSCNILQFSSDDGVCLLRSQRCNGIKESDDNSDERDCRSRLVRTQHGYDAIKSPHHDQDRKDVIMISPVMTNIKKISTEEGVAHVELGVVYGWTDHRVEFVDSKYLRNLFPCDLIWKPEGRLLAGYDRGEEINTTEVYGHCYVFWFERKKETQDINDPLMGSILSPGQIEIRYENHIRASIPCQLQVYRYPFGSYQCNASFHIAEEVDMEWLHWKYYSKHYPLTYKGDRNLLDYYLENATMYFHGRLATLTLHLYGQSQYHLLNSFFPSALVFIISYATLFFPINDFNERIMVSLTAMLVLVGLFASASKSYIKTPYFKLLDVWYTMLIILCFVIAIVNAVINSVRTMELRKQIAPAGDDNTKGPERKRSRKAKRLNLVIKILLLIVFMFQLLIFLLFAAEAEDLIMHTEGLWWSKAFSFA